MISLGAQLRRIRRRLLGIGTAAAAVWGLAAVTLLLLLGVWLDLLWEFPPQWRIATFWAAGIAGAALLAVLAAATVRAARDAAVARRLDREGGVGGTILTGWELSRQQWAARACLADAPNRSLTVSLADMAVADAAAAARQVPLRKVAPLRPLGRSLGTVCLLWTAVAVLAVCLPGLTLTQWNRFTRPYSDVPPFSLTEFEVTPGTTRVLYGSEVEIRVKVTGAPVEQLELVLQTANGQEPPLPMFPESGGVWRAVLAKVVEPTDYHVQAYRARSQKYRLGIITVPLIESGKVRVEPPAYTNRAPYDGPMPKDGVSGLPGTKVQITLHSNRPLQGGVITIYGQTGMPAPLDANDKKAGETPAPRGKPSTFAMKPIEAGGQDVVGEFLISGDGKFECRVIDEDGQESQQTFSGNVTMLADQRPFIRVTQPEKMTLATPTAVLPVTLSAEDDCGVSRLQLFRSLNDSRPLPCDIPVPPRAARRLDQSTGLPLNRYGLEPGDVIKLFGRVEDNDPTGAKGAESSVVTVRIISQEEFEQMMRAKQGLEEMLAKYDAARRRMEQLGERMEGLKKKMKKQDANAKASEETRREMNDLREAMQKAAAEINKSAETPLPYDLDKSLTSELQELAKTSEDLAKEMEKLQGERDLLNKKLGGKLDEMAKKLAGQRQLFNEQAMQPMEFLAQVLPLMADQERFKMLAQWQEDLAERMAAIKGHDGEDNPTLKARMRDLEQEQRQIKEALAVFLENMQEHITKLPDTPDLEELRESAEKFAKDLQSSGASEAMGASEGALAEFAGTRAHKKAKEASDILNELISKCDGMGSGAGNCMKLRFQPKICNSMGNTMAQLLAGMSGGGGDGSGMNGRGETGLYGGLPPSMARMGESGRGPSSRHRRGVSQPSGANPDDGNPRDVLVPGAAAGAAEGSVPVRYRRQVGDYFQRVAEETGEGGH
jgi:hypothetical protein